MFLPLVHLPKLLPYSPTYFDKDYSDTVPPNTAYLGLTSSLILYCTAADVFGILENNSKY